MIAIDLGESGKLSSVLNKVLTPVTHSLLPPNATSAQLTIDEVNKSFAEIGGFVNKKFWVVGYPIMHSRSPNLHNAAYKKLNLPYVFDRLETDDASEVYEKLSETRKKLWWISSDNAFEIGYNEVFA